MFCLRSVYHIECSTIVLLPMSLNASILCRDDEDMSQWSDRDALQESETQAKHSRRKEFKKVGGDAALLVVAL